MKKRNIMTGMLVTISIVVLTVFVAVLLNPLRWPERSIREKMLTLTPIGTKMDDVINIIDENKEWKKYPVRNYGYYYYDGQPSRHYTEREDRVVGVKSMYVYIGEYRMIFATDVTVFYGFDMDSKLIDIAVLKEKDTL